MTGESEGLSRKREGLAPGCRAEGDPGTGEAVGACGGLTEMAEAGGG